MAIKSAQRAKQISSGTSDSDHTLAESLEYLCPGSSTSKVPPEWPPDVFALTALLLLRAGAYREALVQWPPVKGWEGRVRRLGRKWRSAWNRERVPPKEVTALWRKVLDYKNSRLDSISNEHDLCVTLIQLCAIADASAYALGLPTSRAADYDNFYEQGFQLLWPDEHGSTLCKSIHTTRVRVLPKMHTPQTGLTIRSFSHNLALCGSDEMRPEWYTVPSKPGRHRLNLLLIPWPYKLNTGQFVVVKGKIEMPRKFGFFEYRPQATGDDPAEKVRELLRKADNLGMDIDGVILPELALTIQQHKNVRDLVLARKSFLIAGVATPTASGDTANKVYFDLPILGTENLVKIRQSKHHRWRLDDWQIRRYGLEKVLDPGKLWWEHIPVEERCLNIVAMRPWLTISVLICEDLARPDPVGDLVRAVGPNLVVSLLADGPQLPQRWSSRYAMALADDPGSSVLTLTSLGMAQLGHAGKGEKSRSVGLWKNGQSGTVQKIELPRKKEAAVLEIDIKRVEEFTADGRSDGKTAGIPVLDGPKRIRYL
jgi:predicted amidohydrolase